MNEAFRMLFDQVKSGVIWLERSGLVRYANKAAVQMTPVMLGQQLLDPVAQRTVKAAGQDMLRLPFQFELTTQEANPDTIRAVLIKAPVGQDLMLVLNNVSEERWYSQALENLIGYIEAEMARPIESLAGRLPAIMATVQPQPSPELMSLVKDASELSHKLAKLRDLVSIFGQSTIVRNERILLGQLLKGVLAEVVPQAHDRNVTVTNEGLDVELPAIYGSEHWLSKALSEYMEQAIRSAKPGGVVELSVRAVGTRVMVRAHNRGVFVSSHARRVAFVPFGVGDTSKPSEPRRGIGLALSQRIMEEHGGSVRIEDDFDGVDFVLEIPAGAPVSQDAQLSVEQAQRYAKDMSQLLARSMSKRARLSDTPT